MERLRSERGLTLMELIIVLAVIAIISAIIAPNFIAATNRAKLKSDVQSAAVLQSAIELYNAEHATGFGNSTAHISAVDGVISIDFLVGDGYLSEASKEPQTENLRWTYSTRDRLVKADIQNCEENIKEIASNLSESERSWFYPPIAGDGTD